MRYLKFIAFSVILTYGSSLNPAIAQSITVADGGTTVNVVGNRSDITGNQVSGINQFHSFTTFNVDAGKTANFIPNNVNIQNILSRVTGGTPSQIQGIIQASGGVNLFLMNPSGILFGNGASLNVPGSFTATTANAIGFGNNNWFNAAGNNNIANLTNAPNQFAFTSANPGAIVNTGNLAVPSGNSINLIGGTVINTGTIATSGGNITIAAVEGGKAVQITPGNSLLSYVLPIEALNAINPAIGNPVSLPELLTGSPLESASGIEIKNGVVTLIKSQTALPQQGLAVVAGTINSAGPDPNRGKVEVVGRTIAVTNPSFDTSSGFADKTSIRFTASDRIIFGDLGGNELELGDAVESLNIQTTSSNGIVEALNLKDSITIPNGALILNTGSVKLGDLKAIVGLASSAIEITASQDINIGNLFALGSIALNSITGNITAKSIRAFHNPDTFSGKYPTTTLTARGNIEVDSIYAGFVNPSDPEGGNVTLDIFSGGTFRAIGTTEGKYSIQLKNANDDVFNFLKDKTGLEKNDLQSKIKAVDLASGTTRLLLTTISPISIFVGGGALRIRHSGGGGPENIPLSGVSIQGGSSRFEIGPKGIPGEGERYFPSSTSDSFSRFAIEPFSMTVNVINTPIVLQKGISGTVGAITRSVKEDGSLTIGVQDQAFGVLPIEPTKPIEPKPIDPTTQKQNTPNISTIDLENRTALTLAACPKSIALLPTEASRSADSTTPKSTAKNPCIPDNSDDEILRILK